MKKIILSIALVAGLGAMTNVSAMNISDNSTGIVSVLQDDGFVDVKFEELSEPVQAVVREIYKTYDLNALQYNAEKQITKIKATKKDDQSKKEFFLDAEGKEITMEATPVEETMEKKEETPSIGSFDVTQDDGFVAVKVEELNEKVQATIVALGEAYQIDALFFNAEKQITKVDATNKDDQSKKMFYLDAEGKEIPMEATPVKETMEKQEENPFIPSIGSFDVAQDDGFVSVKAEELNEKVQATIVALGEAYQIDALFFNAEKQITKVDATNKDDQSKKMFYLDAEGKEMPMEATPAETKTEEQTEELPIVH